VSHVYCLECGFQNPEAANFCARCGALLEKEEPGSETTLALGPDEIDDDAALALEGLEGPALVIRSGGGRAGEHFIPQGDRTTIGRSPDCDIFLDDVTVSRNHAVMVAQGDRYKLEDQSSLNGTYVNRQRVESAELEDGDELQIGKYRLIFLSK
jgi:FHA domain-containing protein/zinc ribbon protein